MPRFVSYKELPQKKDPSLKWMIATTVDGREVRCWSDQSMAAIREAVAAFRESGTIRELPGEMEGPKVNKYDNSEYFTWAMPGDRKGSGGGGSWSLTAASIARETEAYKLAFTAALGGMREGMTVTAWWDAARPKIFDFAAEILSDIQALAPNRATGTTNGSATSEGGSH